MTPPRVARCPPLHPLNARGDCCSEARLRLSGSIVPRLPHPGLARSAPAGAGTALAWRRNGCAPLGRHLRSGQTDHAIVRRTIDKGDPLHGAGSPRRPSGTARTERARRLLFQGTIETVRLHRAAPAPPGAGAFRACRGRHRTLIMSGRFCALWPSLACLPNGSPDCPQDNRQG